jgi:hypothetical protein
MAMRAAPGLRIEGQQLGTGGANADVRYGKRGCPAGAVLLAGRTCEGGVLASAGSRFATFWVSYVHCVGAPGTLSVVGVGGV